MFETSNRYWSGDIVDLMNNPIVAPPIKSDGSHKFMEFGAPVKNKDGEVVTKPDGDILRVGPFPDK